MLAQDRWHSRLHCLLREWRYISTLAVKRLLFEPDTSRFTLRDYLDRFTYHLFSVCKRTNSNDEVSIHRFIAVVRHYLFQSRCRRLHLSKIFSQNVTGKTRNDQWHFRRPTIYGMWRNLFKWRSVVCRSERHWQWKVLHMLLVWWYSGQHHRGCVARKPKWETDSENQRWVFAIRFFRGYL